MQSGHNLIGPRVRKLTKGLLLSIGSVVVLAIVAELALQIVMPLVYRPRFTRIDPVLGWFHNSSVATVNSLEGHEYRESYNSHGYRSPEHSLEKPAGITRIAFLGDSFVDGSEVGDEELFTWQIQQALSNVEVVNLGVYGFSTAQEAVMLEHVAFAYDPDLVMVLTIPNDFYGNALNFSYFGPAPRFMLEGDSLRFEPTTSPPSREAFRATNLPAPGMAFLHEHSLTYYFLNHLIYQRLTAGKIQRLLQAQTKALSTSDQVELYRRVIRRMKRLCEERGVDFVVVFGYERDQLRPDKDSPNTQIRQLLTEDGVETIELYPELRDAEVGAIESLYYKKDIHWNVRGHRFVADRLRPRIEAWLKDRVGTAGHGTGKVQPDTTLNRT